MWNGRMEDGWKRMMEGQPQSWNIKKHKYTQSQGVSKSTVINTRWLPTHTQTTNTLPWRYPRYCFAFWWDVEVEKAISLLPLNQSRKYTHPQNPTNIQPVASPRLGVVSVFVCVTWIVVALQGSAKKMKILCVFVFMSVCVSFSTAEKPPCRNDCSHWGSDSEDSCLPPPPLCLWGWVCVFVGKPPCVHIY